MAFPAVDSVEAVTRRFKELLEKARKVKPSDSIEPQISATDLLDGESLLLSENIQNQVSHNTVAEIAAKNLLHHLVATTTIDDPSFVQVWNLLDVVLTCSERNQCDGLLIFYLAEELLDSQSIDGCRRVFDYLESRRERLVAGDFLQNSGASKRIVVLRFCNELLRRLSRAEDAVFCGRVFIFLFQTFPLGDKSSVNSRGEFHVENATVFDEPASSKDEKSDGMELDPDSKQEVPSITTESAPTDDDAKAEQKKDSRVLDTDPLYPIFWTLQQAFSNPPKLFSDEYLTEFKNGIEHTIAKFKDVPKVMPTKKQDKSDDKEGPKNESGRAERGDESAGVEDGRGVKRKHDDAEEEFASPYNPKYLTSRDLFELELSDLAFQRHILVQALVLLDFLLSLTEKSKEKTQKWLSAVNNPNRAVQYTYTLSAADAEWASKTRTAITTYLQLLPDGKFYYRMVDTVLSRDKNWVRWKMESCPPIAQPPVSPSEFQEAKTGAQRACTNKRLKSAALGSLNLSFLSDAAASSGLQGLKESSRYTIPTAESLHRGIQEDELDLEMAMTDEDKHRLQEAKASKTWRALRIASKDRLSLFDKIDDGRQLQALFEPEGGDDAGKDERTATETAEGKVDGSVAEAASQVQMQEEQRAEQQGSQVTTR
ncbi:THO complex subunit 1 [Lasiodiplodia hormozganensis]|uniref:THO complex subunit 1 n=1 Tax=Lasiodiplodia hormozganensis TaxID=869390 RepID=A0AA39Z2D5_9PEZI|nr:THO complex subunit 1 [Lasiodiplodia hormozganensis]